jgi:hypothetical protein
MTERRTDPRTEDRISYELVQTDRASGQSAVVGTATFQEGRSMVEAPDNVAIAVRELLGGAFVDRVQADERPRGYRRSGRGQVDMLVPGMAEHFIARLRGLWLAYPDGTVVTAREAAALPASRSRTADTGEATSVVVTDPAVRRVTLAESDQVLAARPIVQANPPVVGLRAPSQRRDVSRTDCGWIT